MTFRASLTHRTLGLLLLSGCPSNAVDDAGVRDAARTDVGSIDGGAVDVGPGLDVGAVDVGEGLDGGTSEATIPIVVGSGSNHGRWLSIDEGLTWCSVRDVAPSTTDFDNPNLLRNITYANGRFVTGSWTAIYVSTNGYAWTDVTGDGEPAFGQWVAQIAYGNDWWVATGGYGTAMRSRDLMTWEVVSDELPGNEASRSLAFGAGMFVTGRDSVGWWASADGTGWTQLDPSGDANVLFDGTDFVNRPDYDRGRGVRLQSGWPDQIRRADDVDGASYSTVATVEETPMHFAFGFAPAADYAPGVVPADLARCLGL